MSTITKDNDGWIEAAPSKEETGPKDEAIENITSQMGELGSENSATNLLKSTYEVTVGVFFTFDNRHKSAITILPSHENLLKGIYSMKFQRPSKIQERLTSPFSPRNMIGQSQSGTGKTAAFVLTMLSRVDESNPAPQAICLAPSRELARQIMSVVTSMGQFTKVTTGYAIKDSPRDAQVQAQIIIGTPGTMADMIRKKAINITGVKVFVLDEADNMLDQQGLGDQTLRVKNATFPPLVRNFAAKFAPSANEIKLKEEELSVEGIKQFYMDCKDEQHKYDVLVDLYSLLTIGQSIIFCKRREVADQIARRMSAEGHQVSSLHGAKDAAERDTTIDDFRDGKSKVLITTNVISRGIDILQVNMVVNYDMPLTGDGKPDPETYLHRIGRTGRFGRKGIAINFVHDRRSWEEMNAIEKALHHPILRVETKDFDEMEKTLQKAMKS
ncbi:ATP-dependent RNA helicase DBP5 [Rhizoctonia solani AG-1 IA]|uniref:RNA helicase n=1 Tax=Thanatephorus cucumeris (strain AG1-IA) TaxID=983506 RepID=L8WTJ2_THACA|nr:ATP-dependent RNA helicase DBP5 [Rhizoctonia solani AG-1 IA]